MPGKVLAWPHSYESNLKWGVRAELRLVHVAVVPRPSSAWGSVAPRVDRHVLVGFSFSLLLAKRLVSMRTVLGLGSRGTSVDGVHSHFCGTCHRYRSSSSPICLIPRPCTKYRRCWSLFCHSHRITPGVVHPVLELGLPSAHYPHSLLVRLPLLVWSRSLHRYWRPMVDGGATRGLALD